MLFEDLLDAAEEATCCSSGFMFRMPRGHLGVRLENRWRDDDGAGEVQRTREKTGRLRLP